MSAQTLTTLVNFDALDGQQPFAPLLQARNGDLYGTTQGGGSAGNYGTLFKFSRRNELKTLHSFCSANACSDGYAPFTPVVQAVNGDIFGTTYAGGASSYCDVSGYLGCGTIFRLTTTGVFSNFYTFCSTGPPCLDGQWPQGLVQAVDGNLYGTTGSGGANGQGTFYRITSTVQQRVAEIMSTASALPLRAAGPCSE